MPSGSISVAYVLSEEIIFAPKSSPCTQICLCDDHVPEHNHRHTYAPICRTTLGLLLGRGGFRLGGLLPVAPDHDDAEEGPHDSGAEEDQDHGDSDGPDARGEEVLERVVGIDKGLV